MDPSIASWANRMPSIRLSFSLMSAATSSVALISPLLIS